LLAAATLIAQAPDRSRPPQLAAAPELRLPALQKRQLSNGLPVLIVELHEVPVAQIHIVIRGGASDDPPGRFGVANMTASMLEQGAGSRSALEIADAIDYLGADLTATSGFDSSVIRLHVPVTRIADALPIMSDVVLRPTFPKDELERLRQERLTAILEARNDPPTMAAVAFAHLLFGSRDRYGTPVYGTADVVKSVTPDDLRAFYAQIYRPDNATLLAVGDLAPDTLLPLLEKSFGQWRAPSGPRPSSRLPAAGQPSARQIYLVDKPAAPQSQIRIGGIGVARGTPDYFPIQVMNTILGGSFASRLNNNLREQHGYTYGAGSAFDMRTSEGPFQASAGVQTDKTAEALKEFFNELTGIRKPVSTDELTRAKNYVALRFPGGFETTGDISRHVEDAIVFDLPDEYFARYIPNIKAVTVEDVQRVAQKYIQPDRFAVVIVGDRRVIEPGVRALNLGPIKDVTLDEVFGLAP
jgi:predicted Zn-dependent peptidase